MHLRVGQCETKQKGIDAKNIAKCLHNRNAPTFANQNRLGTERCPQRILRRIREFGMRIDEIGFAIMAGPHLDLHPGRTMAFEVIGHLAHDVCRVLIGHEAE